jgi:hypothetical protein
MVGDAESCFDLCRHAAGWSFGSYLIPLELSCISLSGKLSSGFVKSKLIFIFAKFKMSAGATSFKELDFFKSVLIRLV